MWAVEALKRRIGPRRGEFGALTKGTTLKKGSRGPEKGRSSVGGREVEP